MLVWKWVAQNLDMLSAWISTPEKPTNKAPCPPSRTERSSAISQQSTLQELAVLGCLGSVRKERPRTSRKLSKGRARQDSYLRPCARQMRAGSPHSLRRHQRITPPRRRWSNGVMEQSRSAAFFRLLLLQHSITPLLHRSLPGETFVR